MLNFLAVHSLIPVEIRSIVKNSARFSRGGCADPPEIFANFSYTKLSNASLLPSNLTLEEFSPCEYLPNLQQVLFSTDELDDNVTYETLVVVPESLKTTLEDQLGNQTEINGEFVSCWVVISIVHCTTSFCLHLFLLLQCIAYSYLKHLGISPYAVSSISLLICFQFGLREENWSIQERNQQL